MWPLYYGRSYPSEGERSARVLVRRLPVGGGASARAKRVAFSVSTRRRRRTRCRRARDSCWQQYRDSQPHDPAFFRGALRQMYNTHSEIPSLDRVLVREYPGWTQETPDVVKADVFLEHLREWEASERDAAIW